MAVNAEDLISPKGPVETDLFPGEVSQGDNTKLLARLTEYVNRGVAEVADFTFDPTSKRDQAVTAWALQLAFRAAHTLALSRPAEDDHGVEVMGKTLFTKDQRQGLDDLANNYLADYFNIVEDTGGTTAAAMGIPSHSVKNTFVW